MPRTVLVLQMHTSMIVTGLFHVHYGFSEQTTGENIFL